MTQGVISVFRNYNKAQLVVGAFGLLRTPSAASLLPHPAFPSWNYFNKVKALKSRNRDSFVDQSLGEGKVNHGRATGTEANICWMPTLCLSPCQAFSTSFIVSSIILLDLRYSVVNHASGCLLVFLKNKLRWPLSFPFYRWEDWLAQGPLQPIMMKLECGPRP